MTADLKREFLRLLEEDEEFRYAVAGRIGILEVLKRLDRHESHIVEMLKRLDRLEENQNRLWENVKALREGQNRLWEEVRDMRKTINRMSVTLERLTISVEEEAASFIRHNVRERLGVDIRLGRAFVDATEIDLYGTDGDLCVIGEATVRLGTNLVEELIKKVELLKAKRPDMLRRRLIKVIYADYATPEAIELAKERKVWVLKWSGDLTPMVVEEL
ncbi:MAG: hypothetical protein QXM81_01985 [Nitrososphaerota archaeon]